VRLVLLFKNIFMLEIKNPIDVRKFVTDNITPYEGD
jgi:hypothetical protein